MSQHFPLIAPPTPTTHVCDVDDVGDTYDPLSGQSECDSDSNTEDRKVDCVPSWCLEFGPQTGVINKIYNLYHHALG